MPNALSKSKKLLWLSFSLVVAGVWIGAWLADFNAPYTPDNYNRAFGVLLCLGSVLVFQIFLGFIARIVGGSWVLHGLVPLFFAPIGPMLAWLSLWDKRENLKRQNQ